MKLSLCIAQGASLFFNFFFLLSFLFHCRSIASPCHSNISRLCQTGRSINFKMFHVVEMKQEKETTEPVKAFKLKALKKRGKEKCWKPGENSWFDRASIFILLGKLIGIATRASPSLGSNYEERFIIIFPVKFMYARHIEANALKMKEINEIVFVCRHWNGRRTLCT